MNTFSDPRHDEGFTHPVWCEAHPGTHELRDDCLYPHNADVPYGNPDPIGHPLTPHD